MCLLFFFFKQKTAYEMRSSDWSSDVCSSDLVEAKNLIDGRKLNNRFRSADTVEKVRLDTKDFQYLYAEGDDLVFMDKDTYEQITISKDVIGDAHEFLQDGMEVVLELWEERPISVELPEQIEATIVEADAVVKGQTASSSYKPAILDNGVRVMVPPHITRDRKSTRLNSSH